MILANILRGRLDPPLVHLHGPGGSGKTTIAMACAASIAARSSTVAWLDTSRGFSPARFKQVSLGTAGTDASRSLLYTRASTAVALDTAVGTLVDSAPAWHVRLVVLDTAFGCLDIRSEDPAFRRVAWLQARELLGRVAVLAYIALAVELGKAPSLAILSRATGYASSSLYNSCKRVLRGSGFDVPGRLSAVDVRSLLCPGVEPLATGALARENVAPAEVLVVDGGNDDDTGDDEDVDSIGDDDKGASAVAIPAVASVRPAMARCPVPVPGCWRPAGKRLAVLGRPSRAAPSVPWHRTWKGREALPPRVETIEAKEGLPPRDPGGRPRYVRPDRGKRPWYAGLACG